MNESLTQFWVESDVVDDLFEFHRDWFHSLTDTEISDLDAYYGLISRPDNLAAWRESAMSRDDSIELRARKALRHLLDANGASATMPELKV